MQSAFPTHVHLLQALERSLFYHNPAEQAHRNTMERSDRHSSRPVCWSDISMQGWVSSPVKPCLDDRGWHDWCISNKTTHLRWPLCSSWLLTKFRNRSRIDTASRADSWVGEHTTTILATCFWRQASFWPSFDTTCWRRNDTQSFAIQSTPSSQGSSSHSNDAQLEVPALAELKRKRRANALYDVDDVEFWRHHDDEDPNCDPIAWTGGFVSAAEGPNW